MEFKGTKGNWYLQDYTDAYTNIIRCDNGKYEKLYIGCTSQSTLIEERHNARLMASAPDLLESLEECAELLNILASRLGCQTQDAALKSDADSFGALSALDRAREAINKALGLSQP